VYYSDKLLKIAHVVIDTIDTWDETKLQEVVNKKHGSSEKSKPKTEIVCYLYWNNSSVLLLE